MCGTAPWEWEDDPNAYVAVEERCWGCYHKDNARHDRTDQMPGTHIALVTQRQAEKMANQKALRPRRHRG